MVQAKEGDGADGDVLGSWVLLDRGLSFDCGKELVRTEGVLFWALGWFGIAFYNALASAGVCV
ncbi:hypothetical protein HMPREF3026_03385 [Lactobacillus sp. HMSC073D04]|nr:hypothetical protein HMPREF3026_03385 [Lactobacillus sp. HMSC073D04]